jgi:hypothetical protein
MKSRQYVHRKIFAFSIAAILIISSCSPASEQNDAIPTSQTTAGPTPIPEEYSGLSNLLEARIASGEWTHEEGLVTILEFIAGETTGEEILAGATITSTTATGLILQAQQYLETGTDEAAKIEMQRLLSALVPSKERLDLYSAPANGSAGRSPGHSAQIDCRALQADGFPVDRATRCFERYEAEVGDGKILYIYFPEEWTLEVIRDHFIEETQQAVVDSIRAYGGLGLEHRSITVFFTLLADPTTEPGSSTYASAELALAGAPITNCEVAIYPAGAGLAYYSGVGPFKQTIAHEMFHCFQFWNYHAASREVPYGEADWWMEGTAEYFSNTVYPTVNAEYEYLDSFNDRSPTTSLIAMEYENFLFFQHLGNEIGNAGVIRLIEAMPTGSGESQADALSAFPDIEELFHNFGRAYLDGTIMDTGGGVVPGNPGFPREVRFNESVENAIPAVSRFILQRTKLIFPEERHFLLEVGSEGAEGTNAARIGSAGAWEVMSPQEFDVSCGAKEMVVLTTTSAPDGQYHLLLKVTVSTGPICDECLLGLWQLDNASYEAYWYATPAGEKEGVTYRGVSGTMWASYSFDGLVLNGWTDFKIGYTQEISGIPNQDVAITLNGTGQASYLIFGDTLTYSDSISDYEIVIAMNNRVVGTTGVTPESFGGGLGSVPVRYVCTEDTLQFISADYPQLNELIFLRAE